MADYCAGNGAHFVFGVLTPGPEFRENSRETGPRSPAAGFQGSDPPLGAHFTEAKRESGLCCSDFSRAKCKSGLCCWDFSRAKRESGLCCSDFSQAKRESRLCQWDFSQAKRETAPVRDFSQAKRESRLCHWDFCEAKRETVPLRDFCKAKWKSFRPQRARKKALPYYARKCFPGARALSNQS